MSSWDRIEIQEPHAGRAILGGLVATIVITILMYLVPATGTAVWNVPSMIGKVITFDQPVIGQAMWGWGLAIYIALGVFVVPACYAYWIYSYLPGPNWLRGVTYGALLWLLVQVAIMPLIGQGAFDRKGPAPAAEILSQLVLWLIYGFILGLAAGRQQVWGHRPHAQGSYS